MMPHRYLAMAGYAAFDEVVWRRPAAGNALFLTFDDGPDPAATPALLALLADLDVPATFFLTGENLWLERRRLERYDYSPHALGSHGFRHRPHLLVGAERLARELDLTDRLVKRCGGRPTALMRPPYGLFGPALRAVVRARGERLALWSVMGYDFRWPAARVGRHLERQSRAGDVVVLHDTARTWPVLREVLPGWVAGCRARGLAFARMG